MEITRNNYEYFMIDYIEGYLNADEHKSMQLFLALNPDVAEEVKELQGCIIRDQVGEGIDKSKLYKKLTEVSEITENNFEEFCVAYYENDLDIETRKHLKQYIASDLRREKTFSLYGSIKLVPDKKVVFPSKKSLKKFDISYRRKLYYYSVSAAAVIAMALILRFYPGMKNNENVSEAGQSIISSTESKTGTEFYPEIESLKRKENIQDKRNNEIAVIDTQNNNKKDYIRLASAFPREALIENNMFNEPALITRNTSEVNITITNQVDSNNEIVQNTNTPKLHEGILLKALKIGVHGLGNLTETDLELIAQSDKDGNIIELGISSGEFEISRKKINTNQQRNL